METTRRHGIRQGGWRAGLVLFFLSALLCVVTAELTARLFWRIWYGVSLLKPGEILYAYYPELRTVGDLPGALRAAAERPPAHTDEFYDILFLGGSVLHRDWSSVELELREQLAHGGRRNVRIFNLAMPAHTSRDSLLKYAALDKARFDLVIFYHAINETRANNIPPDIFQQNYGHYSWYEWVNALAPYHGTAVLALPYTLRYLVLSARQVVMKERYLSTYRVPEHWVHHGREFKSAASFQQNLRAVLDLAAERGDRTLIMTFATYVPENYSFEAFKQKRLDYGLHRAPIEWWGPREQVLAAVDAHNEIVRRTAAQRPNVVFVDQASLMQGSPRYFNDPCHFTVLGSTRFVENILKVLDSSEQIQ